MPPLTLESSAFSPGDSIPRVHSCEGKDVSPPLSWSDGPADTRSWALIAEDPDAPRGTWVHWVVYDLPPGAGGLPEAVQELPAGARGGLNDWHRTGYGGPCPPVGRHRYFFKLFALDQPLGDLGEPTKAQLERAMQGHVVARAELVGTYQKRK